MSHIGCVLRCQDIQQLSLVSHLVSYVCIVIEGQCHMIYVFAICLYFYQIFWHMSHILSHYVLENMSYVICLMFCHMCYMFIICFPENCNFLENVWIFKLYLFHMFLSYVISFSHVFHNIMLLICLSYVACLVVLSMNVLPISRNGKFIRKCVYLL